MVVIWSKAFNICLQSTTTPQLFPALSQLSTSYPPPRSHRVFKVVVLSHTTPQLIMGGGARVSHGYLVGKSASPAQQNGKNKRNPRWTNNAEVACPGKWLAVKEYVRKNGNPQAALPQGARVKCWGFALGQPGFLKVYGPEGVTKGRVIARGKAIIESLQTDDEFHAMRAAHSESSEMSGTIEVVVVNRKDMRRHTEKKAAEMIARVLILNLNRIRLSKAITKLLEQGVEDDFVASVAKRTGKVAPKGRADQDTNWRRNEEPVKAPIERRSRQRNQQTTRRAGRSDVPSWR